MSQLQDTRDDPAAEDALFTIGNRVDDDGPRVEVDMADGDRSFEFVLEILQWSRTLDDDVLCLKLIAHLARHVGLRRGGSIAADEMFELMLTSSRASALADQIRK